MKTVKAQLSRALERPDPAIRFYLFHGPDEAGSRALAIKLLKGLGDAEKFIVLGQAVRSDPATLADEAGAMALFGGPRAIWIEPASDEIAEGVAALLDAPACESAVVAVAGTLRKSSELLKLAEAHPAALSHVSWVPEGRDMDRLITDLARAEGLRVPPDLVERLAGAANNNQAIAARELEKFALFLGASPEQPRELDHATVDLLGADSGEGDLMRLGDLALAGRMEELLGELARLSQGSLEAIPALRALQRRLLMIAPLRARVEQGQSVSDVLASMGKSLFWKDKPLVQRLLSTWSSERLAEIANRAAAVERQIMLTQASDQATFAQELVTIGRVAGRAR